jgi:hypothetical protein
LFDETFNGRSVYGGYLEPAWCGYGELCDPSCKSFIFTLLNNLRNPPAKFALSRTMSAAGMSSGSHLCFDRYDFCFGEEGHFSHYPESYANPLGHGGSLFAGEGMKGPGKVNLLVGRWELWQLS